METLDLAFAAIGGLVLAIALVSRLLRRSLLSETLVALAAGVVLGPALLGVVDLGAESEAAVLEHGARLTLAVALMAVAMHLREQGPFREWRTLLVLIAVVMPAMWLVSSLLAATILGLSLWAALLIGAIVTPTDPVLAAATVTGEQAEEHLPGRIRRALLAESGANDGLAHLFVFLPIVVLARPSGEAASHWLTHTVLRETVGGVLLGAAVGLLGGVLLERARRAGHVAREYLSSFGLALSLAVLGLAAVLQLADVLAVFVAAVAFVSRLSAEDEEVEEHVQEPVSKMLLLPIFALLGASLPWDEWRDLGWQGAAFAVAVLLLRRLPVVLAALPLLARRPLPDALFLGWFGPIGVSALLYARLAMDSSAVAAVWPAATLVIAASVVAHGMTAMPGQARFPALERRLSR